MRSLFALTLCLAILVVAVPPVVGQETTPAQVLPEDHPDRPQKPDHVGSKGFFGAVGSVLIYPFRPVDHAAKSLAIWLDENCGSFAAGVEATSGLARCFPRHRTTTYNYSGRSSVRVGLNLHNDKLRKTGPQFGITTSASWHKYQRYTGYAGWNDPLTHPYVRLTGFYDIQTQEEFWGVGPDSREKDLTTYGWERMGAEAQVGVPRHYRINGHVGVRYEESIIYGGRDSGEPRIDDVDEGFSPSQAPGLGVERQEYVVPNAQVVLDLTRQPGGRPTLGVIVKGWWEMFGNQNDLPFEWTTIGAEASAHLGNNWHILSMIWGFEEADPEDPADNVLFAYMPSLGGSRTLRGFSSHRFRDLAAGWGAVSYRYTLWRNHIEDRDAPTATIESRLFYDFGGVAPTLDDVKFSEHESYGIELRMYGAAGHTLGVGLAHGDEGLSFNVAMRDVF